MVSSYIYVKKYYITALMVLFLMAFSFNISAQEAEKTEPLYEITGVSCTVDGNTRENLLENYMEIRVGEQFLTLEELQNYLLDKQVYLNNNRIFAEGTVTIGRIDKRNDSTDQVYVDVWAKDTWNIIVLPYFKYDSNDGLLLSFRGRHYNFLGSMEKLAFNLDYSYTEEGNHLFSFNGDFSLPFIVWERDWVFDIGYNTEYEEATGETYPVSLNLNADLGYLFTLFDERWRVNLNNEYRLNDRDSDPDPGEEAIPDDYYFTSGLSVGGSVPTGISVGHHKVTWKPNLSTSISYVPGTSISEGRRGLSGAFSQSVGWGRVDWTGNYRDGYTVSLSNSNSYNFLTESYSHNIRLFTQFFDSWGWGGLNSRFQGFYNFDGSSSNAGEPLRGILDNRIDDVEAGAYLNLDLPFNMWIWFMSRWFEGHLSPFVDVGWFQYSNEALQSDPFWYSAGIEAFAFPKAARSFYLRISAGIDMEAFLDDFSLSAVAPRDEEPRLELYIGLGHHY